ncbi:MAG: ABC transporter permease [Anaerolineae bacterium]
MFQYLVRRVLQIIPLLLLTSVIIFLLVRLAPGGPLAAAERNPNVTPEQLALLRHKYGLDQPLYVQYVKWVGQLLQGNLGESIKMHRPVGELIMERLPNTLLLVGLSFLVTTMIAIPVGVYSAIKQYSIGDYIITTLTFIGQSIPIYWFGLVLILVFYVWLKNPFTGGPIFPGGGMYSIDKEHDLLDRLWHLVLPITMLSLTWIAWYSRFLRGSMLEVIHSDYVRTARAKGLSENVVRYRHALKNAAIPLLTLMALDLPALFGGALFTEMVFSWPGMGRLFWDAARARDYPILLSVVLINSVLIVFFNLLADIGYAFLDPRIRYTGSDT